MERFKFLRTPHLPYSLGRDADDIVLDTTECFEGKEVVVSQKIDGENCNIYSDGYMHARSRDSKHHPSRSWVKSIAPSLVGNLPEGWRICGENVFAVHSVAYKELPTYFFVFAIYDHDNICLSWEETEEMCQLLGLTTVPVIYKGIWDEKFIQSLWTGKGCFPTFEADMITPCEAEGYVVRLAQSFSYEEYGKSAGKFVRKSHVRTDQHWMEKPVVPNLLKIG